MYLRWNLGKDVASGGGGEREGGREGGGGREKGKEEKAGR